MKKTLTKKKIAIYPGTFDPVTYGHLDLLNRALKIFDKVIVAVAVNESKKPLFSLDERVKMIRDSIGKNVSVEIECFSGLVVDYAAKKGVRSLIRGIRMFSDFENEFQMALINRKLNQEVETLFLMPNESYTCLTSRLMKEITSLGGDVSGYVTPVVHKKLRMKALELKAQDADVGS